MTRIAFRVDGGKKIGLGHLIRCLSLAKAFPHELAIFFIVKEEKSIQQLLNQHRFEVVTIKQKLADEEELKAVRDIIISHKIDILITDSYQIRQYYLMKIKKIVKKLVTIDDSASFIFSSDIVINGNIYAPRLDYRSNDGRTRFLLGMDYLLLDQGFKDLPKRDLKRKVESVLITMGGSDQLNYTVKIINWLGNMSEDYQYNIIIGPNFTNLGEISNKVAKSGKRISLYFNQYKLSSLMMKSDLAISAGGTTIYQLLATGLPTIALIQAENQIKTVDTLEKRGLILSLNKGSGDSLDFVSLKKAFFRLSRDYLLRKEMSAEGQGLIDGYGAKRCRDIILNGD